MLLEREWIHIVPIGALNLLLEPALFLVAAAYNLPGCSSTSFNLHKFGTGCAKGYVSDDVVFSILLLVCWLCCLVLVGCPNVTHGKRAAVARHFHLIDLSASLVRFILEVNPSLVEPYKHDCLPKLALQLDE